MGNNTGQKLTENLRRWSGYVEQDNSESSGTDGWSLG